MGLVLSSSPSLVFLGVNKSKIGFKLLGGNGMG